MASQEKLFSAKEIKHEAYSAISELRYLLIVVVIFSIISLTFCSLYMAKAITTPINNLAEVSKKITEGDFQYKAIIYSNDEIGLLSDAFNKMTAKITHSNSILEKKVEELNREIAERKLAEAEKEQLINDLRKASAEIKTLKGIFPICASCKKIRDDKGYWNQIESYIRDHSEAEFSHGICPDCEKKLYPD